MIKLESAHIEEVRGIRESSISISEKRSTRFQVPMDRARAVSLMRLNLVSPGISED